MYANLNIYNIYNIYVIQGKNEYDMIYIYI